MFHFSHFCSLLLSITEEYTQPTHLMKYSQSEKILRTGDKRAITFYKNIKLKTIQPQIRIKAKQKCILVSKNPWGQAITSTQIENLLTRLNDSPNILYRAIQHKNKQNISPNTNKFKPIAILSQTGPRFNDCDDHPRTVKASRKLPHVNSQKEVGLASEARLMKKIEAAKKKYVEQYRKMLLGMKKINLDTDLPRIKYVQQNEMCDRINLMHVGSKI